jgi:membrane-associated phospholipid phosphatase
VSPKVTGTVSGSSVESRAQGSISAAVLQQHGASPTVRALTAWLATYNLLLSGIWIALLHASAAAVWISAAHVAVAGFVVLAARAARDAPDRLSWADLLPVLLLSLFWLELGHLLPLLHDRTHDGAIVAFERKLFGVNPHEVWWPAVRGLHALMEAFYFTYYPALILLLVFMAARRPPEAFRDAMLRATITYLSCDAMYLVFPVLGPRAAEVGVLADAVRSQSGGVFMALNDGLRQVGDSLGTAFPSSHVAGVVTATIIAFRHCGRRVGVAMTVAAACVAVSTVYTRNHYFSDALFGVVLALAVQLAPSRLLRGFHARA